MPLSTSSFNYRKSEGKHVQLILLGILIGILLIFAVENLLRMKGGKPYVKDTAELWASQRARASSIGNDALILVGSSRIQLDLDLKVLSEQTGLKPVQLAIDGSPYLEILENLADDESVTGTILVSTTLRKFFPGTNNSRVKKWINVYENNYRNLWYPKKEQLLKAWLQSKSALYSNILPLNELIPLLFDKKKKLNAVYLRTMPNRERTADYSMVKMPDFYLHRVQRDLGVNLPPEAFSSYAAFGEAVVSEARKKNKVFNTDLKRLARTKKAIKKLNMRGVSTIIARFPVSGLIEVIEDNRYPIEQWEKVIAELGVRFINYKDHPSLVYSLPDGSHLDTTQKTPFTRDFAHILMATNNGSISIDVGDLK